MGSLADSGPSSSAPCNDIGKHSLGTLEAQSKYITVSKQGVIVTVCKTFETHVPLLSSLPSRWPPLPVPAKQTTINPGFLNFEGCLPHK